MSLPVIKQRIQQSRFRQFLATIICLIPAWVFANVCVGDIHVPGVSYIGNHPPSVVRFLFLWLNNLVFLVLVGFVWMRPKK